MTHSLVLQRTRSAAKLLTLAPNETTAFVQTLNLKLKISRPRNSAEKALVLDTMENAGEWGATGILPWKVSGLKQEKLFILL